MSAVLELGRDTHETYLEEFGVMALGGTGVSTVVEMPQPPKTQSEEPSFDDEILPTTSGNSASFNSKVDL